jgi:hypothetical protein
VPNVRHSPRRHEAVEISFEDGQVIVNLPKCVLVMSREHFITCLRLGKAYRRAQQRQAQVAPIDGQQKGETLHG